MAIKIPKLTGRLATPEMVPGGGLGGAPRTVWGHAAVTGRLHVASVTEFAAQTILGALKAAAQGGRTGMVDTLSRMAANAIIQTFEEELRRARIEAFEAGVEVGRAEMYARMQAETRAAEGVETIFAKSQHYLRKQDQAAGMELAKELTAYAGTTLAEKEDKSDVDPRPVRSISGWVQAAGLVQGQLAIQFRGSTKTGPVVCVYPDGGGRGALESLLAAPSAGKWVHAHVYASQYQLGSFR